MELAAPRLLPSRFRRYPGSLGAQVRGAVEPAEWTAQERLRLNFPPHGPPGNARLRLACQVGDCRPLLQALLPSLGASRCWAIAAVATAAVPCTGSVPAQPVPAHPARFLCRSHPLQLACQGDLTVVKRSGFWGQGEEVLPALPDPGPGPAGVGAAAAQAMPLGQLEFVLDRRRQRGQQQRQQ